MKNIFSLFTITLLLLSCKDLDKRIYATNKKGITTMQLFFPVTSFIKGEIYTIKKNGINPLKYTTINDRTDSVWLKVEDIDTALSAFLQPEIDTTNLNKFFTEQSFLDKSINAITLTYEASVALPDTMELTNWDVYIDPNTNNVKRIYMVKQINKSTVLQLTWMTNQCCKIVTIVTDEKGLSKIKKEEKIIWDF